MAVGSWCSSRPTPAATPHEACPPRMWPATKCVATREEEQAVSTDTEGPDRPNVYEILQRHVHVDFRVTKKIKPLKPQTLITLNP